MECPRNGGKLSTWNKRPLPINIKGRQRPLSVDTSKPDRLWLRDVSVLNGQVLLWRTCRMSEILARKLTRKYCQNFQIYLRRRSQQLFIPIAESGSDNARLATAARETESVSPGDSSFEVLTFLPEH